MTFWSEAQKAGSFTASRLTQPLKQAASRAALPTALGNNMTNDGKSANGCRPTTRSPRGQNKGIMGRQFVYLERAGAFRAKKMTPYKQPGKWQFATFYNVRRFVACQSARRMYSRIVP